MMLNKLYKRCLCSSSPFPSPQPWLFVGLGNLGDKYKGTRHNVYMQSFVSSNIKTKILWSEFLTKILCWFKAGWFWNDWCICRVTRDSNGYSSLQSYFWKRQVNLLEKAKLYFVTHTCAQSYMFRFRTSGIDLCIWSSWGFVIVSQVLLAIFLFS